MFNYIEDAEKRLEAFLTDAGLSFDGLSKETGNNYIIFGGAIRSAIAGESDCNDIDILVSGHRGFKDFTTVKSYDRNIYMKEVVGRQVQCRGFQKKVDLLTPYGDELVFRNFVNFLAEVDINVGGIGFNHCFGFIETLPNQIKMCKRKCFRVNGGASGYDANKTPERVNKLIKADWMKI